MAINLRQAVKDRREAMTVMELALIYLDDGAPNTAGNRLLSALNRILDRERRRAKKRRKP